jgi:hypothetical protein
MTELETIRAALAQAHELAHVVVANPQMSEDYRRRAELSVRTLLGILYSRLGEVEQTPQRLPDNIKSDY